MQVPKKAAPQVQSEILWRKSFMLALSCGQRANSITDAMERITEAAAFADRCKATMAARFERAQLLLTAPAVQVEAVAASN